MLKHQPTLGGENHNQKSPNQSLVFRYDSSFNEYGFVAKGVRLIGWFDGVPLGNISQRELVVSNLTIYENMDFHVGDQWFADFKEGLDERLTSAHLLTALKQKLPAQILDGPDQAAKPKLTLTYRELVIPLGPEVIPIRSLDALWTTSYVYHSNEYPAYCVTLAERMKSLELRVELPKDPDVW